MHNQHFSNNTFYQNKSAIEKICNIISDYRPDLILSISRKGPRLLELLKYLNLLTTNAPVYSEKALELIDNTMLYNKKILIFDDIIISGTTITDLVSKLSEYNYLELIVVSIAIDSDNIALKKSNDSYLVIPYNKKGQHIKVFHALSFKSGERFRFCSDIVNSLFLLNKPYDIDFPIFYYKLHEHIFNDLVLGDVNNNVYNLTSVYQDNYNMSRYTIIPKDIKKYKYVLYNSFDILKDTASISKYMLPYDIYKIRIYRNIKNDQVSIVPIFTNSIAKKLLKNSSIKHITSINKILSTVYSVIKDNTNADIVIYRIYWYLISYVYILTYFILNDKYYNDILKSNPANCLHYNDISLIFGDEIANIIINILHDNNEEIIKDIIILLKDIKNNDTTDDMDKYQCNLSKEVFDSKRSDIFRRIKPYLDRNFNTEELPARKIASIFEGMYYEIEIEEQRKIKEDGIEKVKNTRLNAGFNIMQLDYIMRYYNYNSSNRNVEISISLDYLVDMGIMIPIFNYYRDDEIFERIYRYGEDALSLQKYSFFIAHCTKKIFDYYKNPKVDNIVDHLPAISYEKIGVILQQELKRTGEINALKINDNSENTINIDFTFSKHGRVLNIEEQYLKNMQFVTWATKKEIIKSYPGRGIIYNDSFFNNMRTNAGQLPALISDDILSKYAIISIYLSLINKTLEASRKIDYLVSISTCGTYIDYLNSILEILRILFHGKKNNIYIYYDKLKWYYETLKNHNEVKTTKRYLSSLIDSSLTKRDLFLYASEDYKNVIEYFENNLSSIELLAFRQNIGPLMEFVLNAKKNENVTERLRSHRYFLENITDICMLLFNMSAKIFEIMFKIQNLRINKPRILPEDQVVNLTDLKFIRERVITINSMGEECNLIMHKLISDCYFNDNYILNSCLKITIDDMPTTSTKLNIKDILKEYIYDKINTILKTIYRNYVTINKYMIDNYKNNNWRIIIREREYEDLIMKEYIKEVIQLSTKCVSENDEIKPKVAAAIIKNNKVIASAYRNEDKSGSHAEFLVISKAKSSKYDLQGAVIITTLEPCIERGITKIPCAEHIKSNGFSKVFIGMLDPNPKIIGKGLLYLQSNDIEFQMFPFEKMQEVRAINEEFENKYLGKAKTKISFENGINANEQILYQEYSVTNGKSDIIIYVKIHRFICDYLSEQDLKDLCMHLRVNYNNLTGLTIYELSSSFLDYIKKLPTEYMEYLIKAIETLYSDKWNKFNQEYADI